MSRFLEIMEQRRSIYNLENKSTLTNEELQTLVYDATRFVPSAFNMQSTAAVLLLNQHHEKLWNIVLNTLEQIVPPENFQQTKEKNKSFSNGYGTILLFRDEEILNQSRKQHPSYEHLVEEWAQQETGMLQYALWNLLAEADMGGSLQHYNPIIDAEVAQEWKIPKNWTLLAQLPFGTYSIPPKEKTFKRMDERVLSFK